MLGRVWAFVRERWERLTPLVTGLVVMGAVLGLERSLLPPMASAVWGQDSFKAKVLFIVTFGCAKAATNLAAGPLADRFGRRKTLILGMALGLPVPLVVLFANSWSLIVAVNILFGASQGFIGSSLIFMMVDTFGVAAKGAAVGASEMTIYSSVAAVSVIAAALAQKYGYRPIPFLLGAVVSAIGLAVAFLVKDTMDLVQQQQDAAHGGGGRGRDEGGERDEVRLLEEVQVADAVGGVDNLDELDVGAPMHVIVTSDSAFQAMVRLLVNRNFVLTTLCGMTDKGKDAVIWGLAPDYLLGQGLSLAATGGIISCYTGAWGISQLGFGGLSDTFGRKLFLTLGLALNTVGLLLFVAVPEMTFWYPARVLLWSLSMLILGVGTASIYPTMQAAAADEVEPAYRGSSLGIYRAFRDFGLAVGALSVSSVADAFGLAWSFFVLACVVGCVFVGMVVGFTPRAQYARLPCFA